MDKKYYATRFRVLLTDLNNDAYQAKKAGLDLGELLEVDWQRLLNRAMELEGYNPGAGGDYSLEAMEAKRGS